MNKSRERKKFQPISFDQQLKIIIKSIYFNVTKQKSKKTILMQKLI